MSLRKIGNRWQIRLRIGGGGRIERTLPPGATRDDARQLEAQIRRAQIDAAVGRKPQYLIDDVLDQWQRTGAEQLRSWHKSLKYRFGILKSEYTRNKPLADLVAVAEKIKADGQRENLNPVTINRYVAILRKAGNLAERWGWTDLPLGRRIKLLPEHSDRHVYLTPENVDLLARCAEPITADMIRFAALTGLRRGEMLALQPDQVRDGVLYLTTRTKTNRPRAIPLPPQAARIASKRLPWGISTDQLAARWSVARTAANLPHAHWHDLRHTYASWLVQAGQSLTAVRDLLGHSSLAVTHRYAHLAPIHLAAAVSHLPQLGAKVGKKRATPAKKKAA